MRAMVGRFGEVCRRRGLKFNASKSKVMVLNGEEGLECEIRVDGIRLKQVSEFKYLGCVFDESRAECSRKVGSGRGGVGAIRYLVNARDWQIECGRVLHETLLIPVLMYVSETMLWREKKKTRIKAVQMDNLRDLLGIRRMDRVCNARIRELCGVKKGQTKGLMKVFSVIRPCEEDGEGQDC